jgi:hypothetical protein
VSYPIENRLRPPVELISAEACSSGPPSWPPPRRGSRWGRNWHWGMSLALLAGSAWRAGQAWEVIRYQGNLRHLKAVCPETETPSPGAMKSVPGHGVSLDGAPHARRLNDAMQPRNRRYVEPSWLYRTLRRFERKYEHHPTPQHPKAARIDASGGLVEPVGAIAGYRRQPGPAWRGAERGEPSSCRCPAGSGTPWCWERRGWARPGSQNS